MASRWRRDQSSRDERDGRDWHGAYAFTVGGVQREWTGAGERWGRPRRDAARRDATASDAGDSGEMGEGDDRWGRAVSGRGQGAAGWVALELDGLGPNECPLSDFSGITSSFSFNFF